MAVDFGNELFLFSTHCEPNVVSLAVGTMKNKRTIPLTDDEALRLAYRLMALARGGETVGFEKLPRLAQLGDAI